ncbi:hypothetical protein NB231_06795 [Nitrococcus mobilis Nb-231]|uniref:Uncharacterized protein n=1 Tax=Nitrococcus mobilis Nb-231 TaxID=314278 RepID=A4BV93_9GAMM|nr:hypothetical protein NB231_06795 [Nitrococcus mobilis Nb-231]
MKHFLYGVRPDTVACYGGAQSSGPWQPGVAHGVWVIFKLAEAVADGGSTIIIDSCRLPTE